MREGKDMQIRISHRDLCWFGTGLILAIGFLASGSSRIGSAQQPKPPVAQPAQPPASSQGVVDSPEWQATRQEFYNWLSVQQVYSEQEIQKMISDLRLRVSAMNEQQRRAFLKDMQSRLAVLNSEQAQQARAWFNENLSRMTPKGQAKLRQQVPDVANMNAAQLQQALSQKQMQFQSRQRGQAASAQFRTQQNQQIMQMNQQRNQAFQDARMRQQSAVSSQATNRVQQGFQQSNQNAQSNIRAAEAASAPLFSPYIWANPWVW
jgi:hypothetical protein